MKIVKIGLIVGYLLLLIIPFLISGCTRTKVVKLEVSPYLLEECPIPHRKRFSNRGLRQYAVDLHKSLLQCNIDKKAIKKELGQ